MTKRGLSPEQAAQIREKKGLKETKLQKARLKKGFSQAELAVVSGITVRTIREYEHKPEMVNTAKLVTLCKLCMALDCKLEDIIESDELITMLRITK